MELSDALKFIGGASPATAALGFVKGAFGVAQMISGQNKINKYEKQLTPFSTPQEYYDQHNAIKSMAGQGFDAFTLNYLTSHVGEQAASSVGAAERMGGDPNSVAGILDTSLNGYFKIGEENTALNMEHFSKYLNSLQFMGQNKEAEWKSQQDMIKDKIQAAAAEKASGTQNAFGGLNTMTNNIANKQIMDQWDKTHPQGTTPAVGPILNSPITNVATSPINTKPVGSGTDDVLYELGVKLMQLSKNRPQ